MNSRISHKALLAGSLQVPAQVGETRKVAIGRTPLGTVRVAGTTGPSPAHCTPFQIIHVSTKIKKAIHSHVLVVSQEVMKDISLCL